MLLCGETAPTASVLEAFEQPERKKRGVKNLSELFIHLPTTATTPPEFRKKTKAKPTKGFLQNTGLPTVIFDAILVGFALYFAEISVDVAAK
ncbi:MAG TPA: hypothetical protein DEV98_04425 [Clostridiales bacterium]|nr:hypothetical protein [Clostridiales bacterium]